MFLYWCTVDVWIQVHFSSSLFPVFWWTPTPGRGERGITRRRWSSHPVSPRSVPYAHWNDHSHPHPVISLLGASHRIYTSEVSLTNNGSISFFSYTYVRSERNSRLFKACQYFLHKQENKVACYPLFHTVMCTQREMIWKSKRKVVPKCHTLKGNWTPAACFDIYSTWKASMITTSPSVRWTWFSFLDCKLMETWEDSCLHVFFFFSFYAH